MLTKIISDTKKPEKFNTVAPHPLQSWEWGSARKKMGIDVLRIGEFSQNDTLNNVFQITFHKVPYSRFTVGYLPRSVVPSNDVLNLLNHEGIKRNSIFIKIEPYIRKNQLPSNFDQFQQISKRSPHPLFPDWTQIVDLSLSEEKLLEKMKSKTRYNILLAEKKGVNVREMTSGEGFEIFSKLYFETCRRQGYRGHTPNYHRIVFDSLKDGILHILVAFYRDTPLASYELFRFNDVLYYPYGGSSVEHRNLMGTNLLMWEAIRFGKKSGCNFFDMWGSLPPDYSETINDDWAGFTRFKEGYGTEYVEFVGSFDLILKNSAYLAYNFINAIRKKIV